MYSFKIMVCWKDMKWKSMGMYADKKCQVQRTKCKKTGQSVGEITEN